MKPSLYLLITTLLISPFALAQQAPVAVQVPVVVAPVSPGDAELRAQVEAAAQSLAKLSDNAALKNAPGLATAQTRVARAGELVSVPVGFSLGQNRRQAHLLLDNLTSARVWCQAALVKANAVDKIELNEGVELLQTAETTAQFKVDALDKPDPRTTAELLAESARLLEESEAFLKESKEFSAAAEKRAAERRQKAAESERMFQEANKMLEALPKPATPADAQKELENRRKQSLAIEQAKTGLENLSKYIKADAAAAQLRVELSVLQSKYLEAQDAVDKLRSRLKGKGLTENQRQKIEQEVAVAILQEEKAEREYYAAGRQLDEATNQTDKLLPKVPQKPYANPFKPMMFGKGRANSPLQRVGWMLTQDQPDLRTLAIALLYARNDLTKASAAEPQARYAYQTAFTNFRATDAQYQAALAAIEQAHLLHSTNVPHHAPSCNALSRSLCLVALEYRSGSTHRAHARRFRVGTQRRQTHARRDLERPHHRRRSERGHGARAVPKPLLPKRGTR